VLLRWHEASGLGLKCALADAEGRLNGNFPERTGAQLAPVAVQSDRLAFYNTGMTFLEKLQQAERQNGSMLCVGLDPEPAKFPTSFKGEASKIFDFCAAIVDATADLVIAFKPQIAYFAANRAEEHLERLMTHMRQVAPHVPVILDAKRGDIGSTAEQYAREAFERYGADAVTLSPFMGLDSVQPYLKYPGKGAFLLCRTSNPGGDDFQNQRLMGVAGQPLLYEHIAQLAQGPWNLNGQLGLVVGATYPAEIERVRALAPTLPLLIPGVGAQGGDALATVKAGWRDPGSIIVNSSRAVLYASSGADFAQAARAEALRTRDLLKAARPAGA
jgi:orotidine-5'-phosphate decarboxylase